MNPRIISIPVKPPKYYKTNGSHPKASSALCLNSPSGTAHPITIQFKLMQSPHDLIATAYAAFNRRDIDAVLALMQPDVDWPNGMDGTRVHGHDNVRDYWTRQWTTIDPHVDPVSIKQDERANTVVEVHQVVRDLDGKLLVDQIVQHVYVIQDGRIVRMDIQTPPDEPMTTR
jgi:ketosteroid isomerase-like protein